MTTTLSSGNLQALPTAWELAAVSFAYPTNDLALALLDGQWGEAAVEIAGQLGFDLPDTFGSFEDDASDKYGTADDLRHALSVEATKLFIGTVNPEVTPYEGIWYANEKDIQALLYVNPKAMAVERFMKACGLERPEGTNEPLDHVATECELMEYLAIRAFAPEALADQELFAEDQLPGGSAYAAYAEFFNDHIATWVPAFCETVKGKARVAFYQDAAEYFAALVKWNQENLEAR